MHEHALRIMHADKIEALEKLERENKRLREALQNALNVLSGVAVGHLNTIRRDSPAIAKARAALKGD